MTFSAVVLRQIMEGHCDLLDLKLNLVNHVSYGTIVDVIMTCSITNYIDKLVYLLSLYLLLYL